MSTLTIVDLRHEEELCSTACAAGSFSSLQLSRASRALVVPLRSLEIQFHTLPELPMSLTTALD